MANLGGYWKFRSSKMKVYSITATCFLLSSSFAVAGGFELQTLDTSLMYAEGNQAYVSVAKIDASIKGENPLIGAASERQVVKDQTVTNVGSKFDISENLSLGFSTYRSGSIQLDGGNGLNGNIAPTADVNLDSTAMMAIYNLNENFSFLGGVTQNNIGDGNVTTLGGSYAVSNTSKMGYLVGVAYSIPEIALRAELTYQPQTKFATTTAFAPSAAVVCAKMVVDCTDPANAQAFSATNDGITAAGAASVTNLSLPDTIAFNFQTGIAKDTIVTASYRKSSWANAQINIAAPVAITTNFDDAVSYSLGIGRKFTSNLSGSISYSKEESTGSTSTSLFSVSDGSEAISIGLQYKQGNMAISGGISQRKVGNMIVDPGFAAPNPLAGSTMNYSGNTVTAMGMKISFSF